MQRLVLVVLLLIACVATTPAAQGQVRGQVVNRDGVPQLCQLDFYAGADVAYRVTSDRQGFFYLNNPRDGSYAVTVVQGRRKAPPITAAISKGILTPTPFVVPW